MTVQQHLERDLSLEPREAGTKAVVHAGSEGEMLAGILAGDVEAGGVGEDAGVPVRTADQYGDRLAWADRHTIDVDLGGRRAAGVLHRRIPAQHLLDRIR